MAPKKENKDKEPEVEAKEGKATQPDKAEFDKKMEEQNVVINQLQAKLTELNGKINEVGKGKEGKEEFFYKKNAIRAQLDEHQAKINELEEERQKLQTAIKTKQNDNRNMRTEVQNMKKKMPYQSEEEIDKKIAEIEFKIQTESIGLKREKELMKEISELKKTKPLVGKYAKMESGLTAFDGSDVGPIKERLEYVRGLLNEARDAKKVVSEEYKKLTGERSKQMEDMPELYEERDALSKDVGLKIRERNAMRNEFNQKQREWQAFLAEQRQQRQERAKAEREARQAEGALRRLEKELGEIDEQVPMAEEMLLCDNAISYLRTHLPKEEKKDVESKATTFDNPDGTAILLNKKDRDEEFYFAPIKKKQLKTKKNEESKGKAKLVHSMGILQYFDMLKVVAPMSIATIPETIELLEKKKEEFKNSQGDFVEKQKAKKEKLQKKLELLKTGVMPEDDEEEVAEATETTEAVAETVAEAVEA